MKENADIIGSASPINPKQSHLETNGVIQIASMPFKQDQDAPYKGLSPYTEADTHIFFGRDQDIQEIVNNLLAWRVTLLYGKSGVGKSSVLRAGVTHILNEEARQNIIDYDGVPKLAVVVFPSLNRRFSWRDDPLLSLRRQIEQTIAANGWGIQPPKPELSFVETLEAWTEALGGTAGNGELYLILDQFEEYFLYHPDEKGEGTFFTEFSRAVNCPTLQVNFLISIREDTIAALDRFQLQIPNLFGHRLSIGHLTGQAGKTAITEPIEYYNQQHGTAITIEPSLVDEILDAVQVGKVILDESGIGGLDGKLKPPSEMQIETPYLQLVMERLWQEEVVNHQSNLLRLETFERLGKAEQIVKDHLNYQMQLLTEQERQTAASIFQYLVTSSGSKYAYSVRDLSANTGLDKTELKQLLEKLAMGERRIVRPVGTAKPNQPDTQRYEIFHDALAPAILNWRRSYLEQQKLASEAATLLEKQRQERERQRVKAQKRWGLAFLAVGLSTLAIAGVSALQVREARLNLQGSQALVQWETADQLRTLRQAMQAGRTVKAQRLQQQVTAPTLALQQILVNIRERNQWQVFKSVASGFGRSPDGQWLAIASIDGEVSLWNFQQQQWTKPFPTGGGQINSLDLSRDGKRIATASTDGQVQVWSATGSLIRSFPGKKEERGSPVSLSPDGRIVAFVSTTGPIDLVEVETGNRISSLKMDSDRVSNLKFSPDGKQLASVSGGTIVLWDLRGKRLNAWDTQRGRIFDLSFSPVSTASPEGNSQRLAIASADQTASLWDLQGNLLWKFIGHKSPVWSVAFSPDGKQLATGSSDLTVRVWDLAEIGSGKVEASQRLKLSGYNSDIMAISFSQNGQHLATVTRLATASLWSLQERKPTAFVLPPEVRAVAQLTFSPDGQHLATASSEGAARLWDLQGKLLQQFPGGSSVSSWNSRVFLSPDGQQLATISGDGTAQLWHLKGQSVPQTLFQGQADQQAVGLNFKTNPPRLVTTTEHGLIRIWDFQGHQLKELKGHQKRISDASFSPNGQQLATASWDNTARLWDLQSGKSRELKGHRGRIARIRFSPDGRRVATASWDGTARIWDLNGQELVKIENRSPVIGVNFSPDGEHLATASWNNTARVWDLQGHQLAEYRSQAGLWDAAFSPDGRQIAAGGWGGSVTLWPVKDLDQLLKDGCDWMQDYRANPTNPPELKETLKEVCPD